MEREDRRVARLYDRYVELTSFQLARILKDLTDLTGSLSVAIEILLEEKATFTIHLSDYKITYNNKENGNDGYATATGLDFSNHKP